jgi:hypothetical protein
MSVVADVGDDRSVALEMDARVIDAEARVREASAREGLARARARALEARADLLAAEEQIERLGVELADALAQREASAVMLTHARTRHVFEAFASLTQRAGRVRLTIGDLDADLEPGRAS